jgi:hypothetical protein
LITIARTRVGIGISVNRTIIHFSMRRRIEEAAAGRRYGQDGARSGRVLALRSTSLAVRLGV